MNKKGGDDKKGKRKGGMGSKPINRSHQSKSANLASTANTGANPPSLTSSNEATAAFLASHNAIAVPIAPSPSTATTNAATTNATASATSTAAGTSTIVAAPVTTPVPATSAMQSSSVTSDTSAATAAPATPDATAPVAITSAVSASIPQSTQSSTTTDVVRPDTKIPAETAAATNAATASAMFGAAPATSTASKSAISQKTKKMEIKSLKDVDEEDLKRREAAAQAQKEANDARAKKLDEQEKDFATIQLLPNTHEHDLKRAVIKEIILIRHQRQNILSAIDRRLAESDARNEERANAREARDKARMRASLRFDVAKNKLQDIERQIDKRERDASRDTIVKNSTGSTVVILRGEKRTMYGRIAQFGTFFTIAAVGVSVSWLARYMNGTANPEPTPLDALTWGTIAGLFYNPIAAGFEYQYAKRNFTDITVNSNNSAASPSNAAAPVVGKGTKDPNAVQKFTTLTSPTSASVASANKYIVAEDSNNNSKNIDEQLQNELVAARREYNEAAEEVRKLSEGTPQSSPVLTFSSPFSPPNATSQNLRLRRQIQAPMSPLSPTALNDSASLMGSLTTDPVADSGLSNSAASSTVAAAISIAASVATTVKAPPNSSPPSSAPPSKAGGTPLFTPLASAATTATPPLMALASPTTAAPNLPNTVSESSAVNNGSSATNKATV